MLIYNFISRSFSVVKWGIQAHMSRDVVYRKQHNQRITRITKMWEQKILSSFRLFLFCGLFVMQPTPRWFIFLYILLNKTNKSSNICKKISEFQLYIIFWGKNLNIYHDFLKKLSKYKNYVLLPTLQEVENWVALICQNQGKKGEFFLHFTSRNNFFHFHNSFYIDI